MPGQKRKRNSNESVIKQPKKKLKLERKKSGIIDLTVGECKDEPIIIEYDDTTQFSNNSFDAEIKHNILSKYSQNDEDKTNPFYSTDSDDGSYSVSEGGNVTNEKYIHTDIDGLCKWMDDDRITNKLKKLNYLEMDELIDEDLIKQIYQRMQDNKIKSFSKDIENKKCKSYAMALLSIKYITEQNKKREFVIIDNKYPRIVVISLLRECSLKNEKKLNALVNEIGGQAIIGGNPQQSKLYKIQQVCVGTPGNILCMLGNNVINMAETDIIFIENDDIIDNSENLRIQANKIIEYARKDVKIIGLTTKLFIPKYIKYYITTKTIDDIAESIKVLYDIILHKSNACDTNDNYSDNNTIDFDIDNNFCHNKQIIFVPKRQQTYLLQRHLNKRFKDDDIDININIFNGKMMNAERQKNLKEFDEQDIGILITTEAINGYKFSNIVSNIKIDTLINYGDSWCLRSWQLRNLKINDKEGSKIYNICLNKRDENFYKVIEKYSNVSFQKY